MHEGGTPSEGTLTKLQQNVEQASDVIAAVLDPERARKPADRVQVCPNGRPLRADLDPA